MVKRLEILEEIMRETVSSDTECPPLPQYTTHQARDKAEAAKIES